MIRHSLFNSIAVTNGEKFIPLKEMNLTTKQYYSRISGLSSAGLIKRRNGKYSLNLLGKIVYVAHLNIGKALNYYWKLKVIESIETSSDSRLPKVELGQLIDALIDSICIRDIIMDTISGPPPENNPTMPPPTIPTTPAL
ncbi:hypothetical protein BH18THE2_BH18THE2_11470 [soil metagenome]